MKYFTESWFDKIIVLMQYMFTAKTFLLLKVDGKKQGDAQGDITNK